MSNKPKYKKLYLVADCNDGDYLTTFEDITDEDAELLLPIAKIIKNHNGNWNTREMDDETIRDEYGAELTEEQYNIMENIVPYGEFGVHTIKYIKIYTIKVEEDLLK